MISTHHLKGYCESRYGEVATLGEQFRPWDRHRQVLEKDLEYIWIIGKKNLVVDYWQKNTCYSPQHLNISVDKLNGQVRLLDEAVDCADVESNIAQGYCPVHRELEMEGEFQKRVSCCT